MGEVVEANIITKETRREFVAGMIEAMKKHLKKDVEFYIILSKNKDGTIGHANTLYDLDRFDEEEILDVLEDLLMDLRADE